MYVNHYSMASCQKFYQPAAVILYLLIVCLVQETASYWDNSSPSFNTFTVTMTDTPRTNPTNKNGNEFRLNITVTNNVNKCFDVLVTIDKNRHMKQLSNQTSYETCLCSVESFFWDVYVSATTYLTASASMLPYNKNCPEWPSHNEFYYIYNVSHKIDVTP